MAAILRNFTIERGVQFTRKLTLSSGADYPVDLTDATAYAYVRLSQLTTSPSPFPFGTGPLAATFLCEIVGAATEGVIRMSLTAADTKLLARGIYDYDLLVLWTNDYRRRILYGQLNVGEIVTHGPAFDGA